MALNFHSYSLSATHDEHTLMYPYGRECIGGGTFWSDGLFPLYGQDWELIDVDDPWDPVALLPPDPFGMNAESTATALASCIDSLSAFSISGNGPHSFCFGDDTFVNKFQGLCLAMDGKSAGSLYDLNKELLPDRPVCAAVDNLLQHDNIMQEHPSARRVCTVSEHSPPHDAMFFALGYLGIQDLLSARMVCKSLRAAVDDDPLLWKCIHIDTYLCQKITDDELFRLVEKAQGGLQCLSIVNCEKITDHGLRRILESSPRLSKLNLYGCVRLSFEGLLRGLKFMKEFGLGGIKHLRIGNLFSLSEDQFMELEALLERNRCFERKSPKPRFFNLLPPSSVCCDEDVLDIEKCLTCKTYKYVFDCPSDSCKAGSCRACLSCLQRCMHCGVCIREHSEYQELFSLDILCFKCKVPNEAIGH